MAKLLIMSSVNTGVIAPTTPTGSRRV